MPASAPAPRHVYIGFALITLATIVYELLLTRVFSVTTWYHFAFFIISIALFGMATGAVIIYAGRDRFLGEQSIRYLAIFSFWFSLTIVFSFLLHMFIPFGKVDSPLDVVFSVMTYIVMSMPFVFSGCAVALILSRFAKNAETLYAADLVGAALGCLFVILLLSYFDAPSAVFIVAALPLAALLCFTSAQASAVKKQFTQLATLLLVGFLCFGTLHAALVLHGKGIIRPLWVKGGYETQALYEKWNPISRIRVFDEPSMKKTPFGWGLSPNTPVRAVPKQLYLTIDANAGTILTNYTGATDTLAYLKYDMVNAAHILRQHARVFVVGVGGGRDILSALVFDQAHVTGIEVNPAIIDVLTRVYGDFTGHLERDPRVTIANDEARSYLSRSKEQYDIIQISLIDTWAATAAGAYTLTENTLYTKDAWQVFLSHLSQNGILAVSRWYLPARPAESYRLLSLAAASLKDRGIANPRAHLIMLRVMRTTVATGIHNQGISTLLVSPSAFTTLDISRINAYASLMNFDVILSPEGAESPVLASLAAGVDPKQIPETAMYQIDPPTDDNPFFFQTVPMKSVLSMSASPEVQNDANTQATILLYVLFCIVTALTFLCIVIPLRITEKRFPGMRELPLLLYFMGIGGGFILIEVAEMQRFIVFLGHPTYALSVVLFTLLLSAGIGSWTISRISDEAFARSIEQRFIFLFAFLLLLGIAHPMISIFTAYSLHFRILLTILILFLPGFFMGMFFPAGMRVAREQMPEMIAWFWGVNGAMSVFASVLAPILAITDGFHLTYWTGVGCYALTFLVFLALRACSISFCRCQKDEIL